MKRRTLLTGLAMSPVIALAGALPAWAGQAAYDPFATPERLAAIAEIEAAIEAPGAGLIWVQGPPRSGKTELLIRLATKHGSTTSCGSSARTMRRTFERRVFLDYDAYDSYDRNEGCLIKLAERRSESFPDGKVIVFSVDSPHHGDSRYQVIHLPMPDLPLNRKAVIMEAVRDGRMSVNTGRSYLAMATM